eukprot:Pgem_evm1s18654
MDSVIKNTSVAVCAENINANIELAASEINNAKSCTNSKIGFSLESVAKTNHNTTANINSPTNIINNTTTLTIAKNNDTTSADNNNDNTTKGNNKPDHENICEENECVTTNELAKELKLKHVSITQIEEGDTESKESTKPNAVISTNLLWLLLFSALNVTARSSYSLLSQLYKKDEPYSLWGTSSTNTPWLLAFASLSSFPIFIIAWMYQSHKTNRAFFKIKNPRIRMRYYVFGAFLEAVNQITSALSLTSLDIAYYSILKVSSMILTVILFRIFTSKNFNYYHYLGVVIILLSVVMLALPVNNATVGDSTSSQFQTGIICGVVAAIAVAFQGLNMQFFITKEKTKRNFYDTIENITVTTVMAFILVAPLAIGIEHNTWSQLPHIVHQSGKTVAFSLSLAAIIIAYPVTVFTLFMVGSFSSAMFTKILGILRRVAVIFLGAWIYSESLANWNLQVSIVLSFLGSFSYIFGGWKEQRRKKALEKEKELEKEKLPDNDNNNISTTSNHSDYSAITNEIPYARSQCVLPRSIIAHERSFVFAKSQFITRKKTEVHSTIDKEGDANIKPVNTTWF